MQQTSILILKPCLLSLQKCTKNTIFITSPHKVIQFQIVNSHWIENDTNVPQDVNWRNLILFKQLHTRKNEIWSNWQNFKHFEKVVLRKIGGNATAYLFWHMRSYRFPKQRTLYSALTSHMKCIEVAPTSLGRKMN